GVKVSFITDAPANVAQATIIEVPKAAIRRDGDQDVVYVVRDERAERRAVKVASAQNDIARITSGLSGGENVILEGPPELKDGDRVEVVK
ncbi:MAG TPA: efflux RND transporter periplasmic adaptor subunit, partial [Thermoanaerobaculia bacterium]|nr:efflux RND transporter periplasmic adaptor subunit [Thermoanaerobaculia bacterium]